MLKELVFMQYYSNYPQGVFGEFLYALEQQGFFTFILPFLLIFALVYGILEKMNLFKENKSIGPIIALVVAFMAIQFSYVIDFFNVILPKMAIGLTAILVIVILLGLFVPNKPWATYLLFLVGVIVLGIVLVQTAGDVGWRSGQWWADNWPAVVGGVFIIVIVASIVGAANAKPTDTAESVFTKALFGTPKS